MAGKILLEVVTPEKLLLSQEVDEVIAPGSEGEFGVLPGHCHLLSSLRIGELRYKTQDAWHYMSILWGYAEVTPSKVTVMAEMMPFCWSDTGASRRPKTSMSVVRNRPSKRPNRDCRPVGSLPK